MSWQIIDSRDREFRIKEYQIAGINKITKYLNELNLVSSDEKELKIELLHDYLYNYPYTNNTHKINNLLDQFFNNLYTENMYKSIKEMCTSTEISNAIINFYYL